MITVAFKSGLRRSAPAPDNPDFVTANWRISSHPHTWRPPTDVYERDESCIVRVEIAGMKEEDFVIHLDQNLLVIRGTRTDTTERRAYHQMEINFGEFITTVELQMPIDLENVRADYQNGFLSVFLPRAQPKIIKIKDNE